MRFRDEYYFLSNMFPCAISLEINGTPVTFTCAKAAFQAFKCPERAKEFAGINGFAAKKMGRNVTLRKDWEKIKLDVMRQVVGAKFSQNKNLMEKLRKIKGEIVEDNHWHDCFWGRCNGEGLNWLGKILMELRDGA